MTAGGGGLVLYRAVAECSACGVVTDVGPFEDLASASLGEQLPGWLLSSSDWQVRDRFGTPITLCRECMGRPMREVLSAITEARQPA